MWYLEELPIAGGCSSTLFAQVVSIASMEPEGSDFGVPEGSQDARLLSNIASKGPAVSFLVDGIGCIYVGDECLFLITTKKHFTQVQ